MKLFYGVNVKSGVPKNTQPKVRLSKLRNASVKKLDFFPHKLSTTGTFLP